MSCYYKNGKNGANKSKRGNLRKCGRVKKLTFKRNMTTQEVRNTTGFLSFNVEKIQFLSCGQDNVLVKYENQDLHGDGIIELAGQGNVYLLQVIILKIGYLMLAVTRYVATIYQ